MKNLLLRHILFFSIAIIACTSAFGQASLIDIKTSSTKALNIFSRVQDSLKKQFEAKKIAFPPKEMYIRSFKYDRILEVLSLIHISAVFANMLNAESQTIWKDVEGVMNADPKIFPDAEFIKALSYTEVIEMAFYGAQVIHPKTIKPLQNKSIPLHVRCFLNPEPAGTIISNKPVHNLPPIIVLKDKQVLIQFMSKDFSFVEESPINHLHELFDQIKIRPNLSQNTAISIFCCLDDKPEKIERLALAASELFDVQIERGLTLLTIRHYNDEIIKQLTANRIELLSQKTKETIQVLMKEI